jgi:lipocalin
MLAFRFIFLSSASNCVSNEGRENTQKMLRALVVCLLLCATVAPADTRAAMAATVQAQKQRLGLNFIPATVPFLNLTQYLGFWYQMYTDEFNSLFMPDPFCASALYGVNANGTISVRNRDASGNWTSNTRIVDGYAAQDNAADFPGRLTVHLQTGSTPVPAPYWVYSLGPVVNDMYDFVIISDEASLSLFVLARDVDRFLHLYDNAIRNYLSSGGFIVPGVNRPIRVPQGPLCPFR